MTIHVRIGGTWRDVSSVSCRIGGVWRTASQLSVRVGGVWRDALGDRVALTTDTLVHLNRGGTAIVGYRVAANGNIYTREAGGGYTLQYAWLLTGANTDYQVYATTSGPGVSGSASDTWLDTDADRTWEFSTSGNDDSTSLLVSLRDKATTELLKDSVAISMTANSAP